MLHYYKEIVAPNKEGLCRRCKWCNNTVVQAWKYMLKRCHNWTREPLTVLQPHTTSPFVQTIGTAVFFFLFKFAPAAVGYQDPHHNVSHCTSTDVQTCTTDITSFLMFFFFLNVFLLRQYHPASSDPLPQGSLWTHISQTRGGLPHLHCQTSTRSHFICCYWAEGLSSCFLGACLCVSVLCEALTTSCLVALQSPQWRPDHMSF